MRLLPIVDRELRVAARRRGTYWLRLAIALIAILTGGLIFLLDLGVSQRQLSQHIFIGLSVFSMIYCLFAGRISTADCLSEEKREGTLGLLFLTDLKGYDVVFGKLVATSVGAFYGLLAVMPVLAVPLLLGGITNGEFWRAVLVLANTFLFSLAIGILGSSFTREARRAMAANFGLVLLLFVLVPFCSTFVMAYVTRPVPPPAQAVLSSPFYAFYLCADTRYKAQPQFFWLSVGVVHCLTWVLLGLACVIVPRTWQDKPAPRVRTKRARLASLWRAFSYGKAGKLAAHRKKLLDVNAFYWLAARARLKPLHVWIFLLLMTGWWAWGWLGSNILWYDRIITVTLALILNSTLKTWIALESGQQLAEDQKAGALELLLSTPLTVRDILRGQLLALRRQFLKPLILVILVELIFMFAEYSVEGNSKGALNLWLAAIIMLVADVLVLPLVALRVALTAKSPNRATMTTISRILFLPWVLFFIGAGIANLWVELFSANASPPGEKTYLGLWFGAGILVDLLFGISAARQLSRRFRELALRRFAPVTTRAERKLAQRQAAAAAPIAEKVHSPSRRRFGKRVAFAVVILFLLGGYLAIRDWLTPKLPGPLVVSITQSNAPIQVLGGLHNFIILPDHSLWRWSGVPGSPRPETPVPERVGADCDWLQASGSGGLSVGLRTNGTLWHWGWARKSATNSATRLLPEPEPVAPGNDWVSVSSGGSHAMALKRDGTLWAWGDNSRGQLGNGLGPSAVTPVQVGTNSDWLAVKCQGPLTFGIRRNGTLWAWGMSWTYAGGAPNLKNYPVPTQVCRETNWTGLTMGFGVSAGNSLGEIFQPNVSLLGADLGAAGNCTLLATNCQPDHLTTAMCDTPKIFELRADGTLWEKSFSLGTYTAPPGEKWERVGTRSDWVSLSGGWGTAIGVTRDGTVWTWGYDHGRDGSLDFSQRWKLFHERIQRLTGTLPPGVSRGGNGPVTPIQKTPRPLMRLILIN
jgi:ABC-type transport system involved in multi-copper enzyme maturation permease subunit